MDLSQTIPFGDINELATLRDNARAASIEGLMLKRGDSLYVPGRTRFHFHHSPSALVLPVP